MARLVRMMGLASLLVVEDEREIDVLLAHPAVERDFEKKGPLINRFIVSRLRREFTIDGKMMRSMLPQADQSRADGQAVLRAQLDDIAGQNSWPYEAVKAAADYVRGGVDRDGANAALTYVSAYPFLPRDGTGASTDFDAGDYARLFIYYEMISWARRPFSVLGLLNRLSGGVSKARREILAHCGGNDYGLHAVGVTLDNSILILEKMRDAFDEAGELRKMHAPFRWVSMRTAPNFVFRQLKEDYTLPFVERRVPAYTLVQFCLRDSLQPSSYSGYEFAARQWSACPAHQYLLSFFAMVWGTACYGENWVDSLQNMTTSAPQSQSMRSADGSAAGAGL